MKLYINNVKYHHIITDTTQKHDVLQIITVLGNCKLETSTKRAFFVIKQILHSAHISHASVYLQFILNAQKGLENRLRKFDTI